MTSPTRTTRRTPAPLLAAFVVALATGTGDASAAPGSGWERLTPAQQQALAPLQRDWSAFDATRQEKWLAMAARFPSMTPDERQRLQERMTDWARMTPAERERARLQFQQTRELPAAEKQALWHAYQALSDDERRALASRAQPPAPKPVAAAGAAGPAGAGVAKNNLVGSQPSPPARAVSPSMVNARPGATTTTVTTRANPPAHHQPGMPKITATPGFVDQTTLLPQRGPQGAAVLSPPSRGPATTPAAPGPAPASATVAPAPAPAPASAASTVDLRP